MIFVLRVIFFFHLGSVMYHDLHFMDLFDTPPGQNKNLGVRRHANRLYVASRRRPRACLPATMSHTIAQHAQLCLR